MDDIQKAIAFFNDEMEWLIEMKTATDTILREVYKEINGDERIRCTMTAISAMLELQQYRVIGTPEECREAVGRQQAIPARKTTIFEGKDAEKLAAKGLPNFETYKCPKCGRSVAERTLARTLHPDGYIKHKFCNNCGQAIDWSDEE